MIKKITNYIKKYFVIISVILIIVIPFYFLYFKKKEYFHTNEMKKYNVIFASTVRNVEPTIS